MRLIDTGARYVGRFAPSPTGPLHFGSLVGALASFLDARAQQGDWLLRIEDIDPLREPPDAADRILRTLEAHALTWDGPVLYQSTRSDAYEAALESLLKNGDAYFCPCSRKELAANNGIHPYRCREGATTPELGQAIRFKVSDCTLEIWDRIQGALSYRVRAERDDFVLKRKEGFYAYQLAVVVDDAWQGVTHVVRGSDLLDSVPWQLLLQPALKVPQPTYAHIPVITNEGGQKLSKQNHSPALDDEQATTNLWKALGALGLRPATELLGAPPQELLNWAMARWSLSHIAAVKSIAESSLSTPLPLADAEPEG